MKNILIIIIFLFFFSSNANADEAKRYLLKDQKVTEVLVLPFNYKDKNISDKVTTVFINETPFVILLSDQAMPTMLV